MTDKTTYVYLLWDHAEEGPENLAATLDRSKLMGMLDAYFGNWSDEEARREIKNSLIDRLKLSDERLLAEDGSTGISLGYGWGGIHLQVVPLI